MSQKQSDEQYFESLYNEYYAPIFRLISNRLCRHTGNASDAEDLTQEVFIFAAKQISALRSHPNPGGWFSKTAYFMAMNHIHTLARHNEQLFHSLDLQSASSDFTAESDIRLSLQSMLSEEDYTLLYAYTIEKRPHDELCREYGVSHSALKVRIHRLRRFLSNNLILLVTIFLRRYI